MYRSISRMIGRPYVAIVGVLLASVVMAACTSSHYAVTQDRIYSPGEFKYATANKDVRTVIRGNPFDVDVEAFQSVVLRAMQPVNWGFELALTPRTRFTTQPDESANLDYRVEVSFRPDDLVAPTTMCTARGEDGGQADADSVRARMAFCYREQLLSTSVGTLGAGRGAEDAAFSSMITRMTRDLFPHREFRDGDLTRRGARLL